MNSSRRRTLIVLAVAALVGVGAGIAIGLDRGRRSGSRRGLGAGRPGPHGRGAGRRPARRVRERQRQRPAATAARRRTTPRAPSRGRAGRAARDDRRAGGRDRRPAATSRRSTAGPGRGLRRVRPRPPRRRRVSRSSAPPAPPPSRRRSASGGSGFPVWEHSEMTDAVSAQVAGDSARVVATVFTVYADVREPTIEDDIIYLTRTGDRWLIAQAQPHALPRDRRRRPAPVGALAAVAQRLTETMCARGCAPLEDRDVGAFPAQGRRPDPDLPGLEPPVAAAASSVGAGGARCGPRFFERT